ncbi:UNVERIFIED_CONTAM: Helicase-like transcription factor CHR28 [Sesamum indicum]
MVETDEGSPVIMDQIFTLEEEYEDVLLDVEAFWRFVGPPPGSELVVFGSLHGLITDGVQLYAPWMNFPWKSLCRSEMDLLFELWHHSGPHNTVALVILCRLVQITGLKVEFPPAVGGFMGSRVEDTNGLKETNLETSVVRIEDSSTIQGDRTFGDASHAESSCREFTGFQMSDLSHEYINPYLFRSDDELYFPDSSPVTSFGYNDGIMGEEKNPTTAFEDLVRNKAGQSKPKCEISGPSCCEFTGFNMPDLSREYIDPYLFRSDDGIYFPHSSAVKSFGYDDGIMGEEKNPTTPFEDLFRNKAGQSKPTCEISGASPIESGVGTTKYSCMPAVGNEFKEPSPTTLPNDYSKIQGRIPGKKNIPSITSNDIISRASEVVNGVTGRKYYDAPCELSATEGIRWPSSSSLSLIPCKNNGPCAKDEKEETVFESRRTFHSVSMAGETPVQNSTVVAHELDPVLQFPGQPAKLPLPPVKAENDSLKLKMENEVPEKNSYPSKITYQGVQNNMTRQSNVDCDSDVCILEDMSAPACPSRTAMNAKSIVASQFFTSRDTGNQMVAAHSRHKSNDERVIFRVALQRIALSWMVNKETRSACCSGGILADDQGLGKTISTIALILKERSPPSKTPKTNEKQSETETLNLDEDDDGALETYHEGAEPCQVNGSPTNGGKASLQAKGRPSGGTLIVCPTSVLRQWSEELHNKVTSEADLSVLVYYGSNRTKDPLELAKYDVVVTTYAIVSMEVPKQPVVDENDDQIGSPLKEFSSCRKRKLLETMSDKKSSESKKTRKGINNELLENMSGPLAKVGWFRVVLDEAQSIKNHRTQVARACWGLRAKRRWCLSGTPIQNAIDDLYSYFRFLRHEPYAVFRTFCEQLKVPIHRSPKNGYKKLQAVLKTIMLRRTKGTLIDGEPIINLPPKTIELKKVDFSKEERDFYCRLEAESRAQFADPPEDAVVTVCGHVFCNQCICEHIIGDDTQCPTKKCKTSLTISSVFSTSTLRIALSDKLNVANAANSEVAEVSEPGSLRCPEDSSKIKAALDLLLSLSKPQDFAPRKNGSELIHGGCSEKLCICDSAEDSRTLDRIRDSNNLVKVMGEKAIVFSQWTGMLDLLEACLKKSSIQYRRLDGTMPVAARDRAVKDFNSLPQQRKRKMVSSAFGEDETGSRQTRLTVEDLKYLFRVD